MESYKNWIGKKVEVIIDRGLGSKHPKYPDLVYEVNYGYIPNTKSEADSEEIDVYVLGIDQPIRKFVGKVIAIIQRSTGDKEIKLVVANKTNYSDKEIKKIVNFQEKYFKSNILR